MLDHVVGVVGDSASPVDEHGDVNADYELFPLHSSFYCTGKGRRLKGARRV